MIYIVIAVVACCVISYFVDKKSKRQINRVWS